MSNLYHCCKVCLAKVKPLPTQSDILVCNNCKLIFFHQQLTDEELKELYSKLYHTDYDKAYQVHLKQQQLMREGKQPKLGYNKNTVLKKILEFSPISIAEIGAGVGMVGKYLTLKKYHYQGIELEQKIADQAKAAGVNIEAGSFEKLTQYPNSFDAVLAFEVIEHIDNLKLCLQLIHRALKAEGKLGFTVPNFNKRKNYSKNPVKLYQPNPPVHVNFFTEENIPTILAACGFKVIYLKIRPFPDLNFRKKQTYNHLFKAIKGRFHGSTIFCIAEKK